MLTFFFVCLVLVLLTLPIWPYSKTWGYQASTIFAIIAIILLFFIVRSVTYFEYEHDKNGSEIEVESRVK